MTREEARQSEAFQQVRQLGKEFQAGLLTLLFESDDLPQVVRDYSIF